MRRGLEHTEPEGGHDDAVVQRHRVAGCQAIDALQN